MEEALTSSEIVVRYKISKNKLIELFNQGVIRGTQLKPGKQGSMWRTTKTECDRVFLGIEPEQKQAA
jgi:hypothetical protein